MENKIKNENKSLESLSIDENYMPLVNWLRMRGIRVEVCAKQNSMSQNLRESSNE